MTQFIHLRTHSEYSIQEGLLQIEAMVKQAVLYNMPALAITDCSNLFAIVKFYKSCLAHGIKPIIGSEIVIVDDIYNQNSLSKLILLAQNQTGYLNLTKLISKSYADRDSILGPVIKLSLLNSNNGLDNLDGLIALSAGIDGAIGQELLKNNNSNTDKAEEFIKFFAAAFPNRFYLEVNRIGKPNRVQEENYITLILSLADKYKLPVVATNNVMFMDNSDFEAHEARVCINSGYILADPNRPKNYTEQQFFKSTEQVAELFGQLPEVLLNTVEITKRCTVELTLDKNFLPDFPTPNNLSIGEYLMQQAMQGLSKREELILRTKDFKTPDDLAIYKQTLQERLSLEVTVINNMGFPGYFLIVADFIAWAKSNGVPVGPGRGSGAGSLVAYALGITDLNPLDYDLLFERFLNPERVSMPDFDIDFCMEGRDRVIEYVANKYGRNAVSQIITFGTMAAKAVVRDVGRVLGHPYGFVDRIAKLIPFELGMTLDLALEQEKQLLQYYTEDEQVKELIDLAKRLEGIVRNVGKHAGGVVISPGDLTNFTAIYCEEPLAAGGCLVSQFDKDDVEAIGLVKFDFLGLRTLTIINWAVQAINQINNLNKLDLINIELINLADPKTYSLLKSCKTTAVFQLESSGMKDLIKRLQPDCFEDIIALVALFRPGPLQSGMVDDFINRKHGRAVVEYAHPDLEPILKPTYGIILYQEQVMQIAQVLAGYSLGEADLLRRAMGKKKPEEMAKQREVFTSGALKNNISNSVATYIFDLMEKFAGYGFNKSHSAAYALVSYQTAWLKTHYKTAFMAAVLSSDMDNTDKVVIFYEECLSLDIKVLKPNINTCFYKFTCIDDQILYGLGAIKGLGQAAIEIIIDERNKNGIFKDLFDFCARVDLRKVNKRALEALIKSGAVDELHPECSRSILYGNIENAVKNAEQLAKNNASGQIDLFGLDISLDNNKNTPKWLPVSQVFSNSQILQGERDTLGIFLSGHPLDDYKQEIKQLNITKIKQLRLGNNTVLAGVIVGIRKIKTKSGDKLAIVTLDDKSSRTDIVLYSKEAERYQDLLIKDKVIVVVGKVSEDRFTNGLRIQANHIMDMLEAKIAKTNSIRIILTQALLQNGVLLENLAHVLSEYTPGNCDVLLEYATDNGRAIIAPDKKWRVTLTQRLLDRLYLLIPEDCVKLQYHY